MAEAQVRYDGTLQSEGHLQIAVVPGQRLHVRCVSKLCTWSIEADMDSEVIELLQAALRKDNNA